jgi:hypothetical protein
MDRDCRCWRHRRNRQPRCNSLPRDALCGHDCGGFDSDSGCSCYCGSGSFSGVSSGLNSDACCGAVGYVSASSGGQGRFVPDAGDSPHVSCASSSRRKRGFNHNSGNARLDYELASSKSRRVRESYPGLNSLSHGSNPSRGSGRRRKDGFSHSEPYRVAPGEPKFWRFPIGAISWARRPAASSISPARR